MGHALVIRKSIFSSHDKDLILPGLPPTLIQASNNVWQADEARCKSWVNFDSIEAPTKQCLAKASKLDNAYFVLVQVSFH
jgi:hypothetical protein